MVAKVGKILQKRIPFTDRILQTDPTDHESSNNKKDPNRGSQMRILLHWTGADTQKLTKDESTGYWRLDTKWLTSGDKI